MLLLAVQTSYGIDESVPPSKALPTTATAGGLWLLPRKDAANTGRCDVPGNFLIAPKNPWWIGKSRREQDWIRPVTLAGKVAYLVKRGTALELVQADGTQIWRNGSLGVRGILDVLDFGEAGSAVLMSVGQTDLLMVDVATGRRIWAWSAAEGNLLGGPLVWKEGNAYRLSLFPQTSVKGIAFEFTRPNEMPQQLWQQEYTGRFWANFGPFGVVADLNNDGRQDILLAAKPSYVAAIDGDTGRVLFDLHYPIPGENDIGRPYGLIQAADIDGDGFRDAVIASCQVEEYVAVLKNEGGKAFRLVWSHFVEHDLPKDDFELRPQTTSLSDVDGDGRKDLVLGLFNLAGDARWHTVVMDASRGWDHRKTDLADRYFWGCYDLNHDGISEIITSAETSRRCAEGTTLFAADGRSGQDVALLPNCTLVTATRPLPPGVGFYALRATPWFVVLADGTRGLVVRSNGTPHEQLWSIEQNKSNLAPFSPSPVSRLTALSSTAERIEALDQEIKESPLAPELAASQSLVVIAEGHRELVISRSDGTITGGIPDWQRPGELTNSWVVRGVCPAAWIDPSGQRILSAIDPETDHCYLYRPVPGDRHGDPLVTGHPFVKVSLPFPPAREPGMLLPFGQSELLMHVTMKTGVHTLASALLDGNGITLWRDDAEGAYPRQAGILACADGQLRIVMDNHGKILLWDLNGDKHVIAHGWNESVPGRGNGAKYALPITGPFGPKGEPGTILSPGLEQLEILNEQGARLAMTPYGSIYEREWCASAVARIRPAGWDLGMLTQRGVFHCAGVESGRDRWTLDLGVLAIYPSRVTAADVDGDGRDNFLVGLSNGELMALDEEDQKGVILWKTTLDAPILETRMADLDGDGLADIIVETDEGRIHVFRSAQQVP